MRPVKGRRTSTVDPRISSSPEAAKRVDASTRKQAGVPLPANLSLLHPSNAQDIFYDIGLKHSLG
jgi:hypothetical protein